VSFPFMFFDQNSVCSACVPCVLHDPPISSSYPL
jgi:hypothetical protein